MTQQNPSPRAAAVAFTGTPFTPALVDAMYALRANGGTPWDGEDSVLAFARLAPANRQPWLDLETAIASKTDPEAALAAAELLLSGSAPGELPAPTMGTDADVLALWGVHLLTAPARRVRVRALCRLVAGSEFPDVVLSSLNDEIAPLV